MDSGTRLRRNLDLPYRGLDDEAVVVNPRSREVHLLSPTAARIWELLATERTLGDLLQALGAEFDGAPDEIRQSVEAFLRELEDKQLVVVSAPAASAAAGGP